MFKTINITNLFRETTVAEKGESDGPIGDGESHYKYISMLQFGRFYVFMTITTK